MENPEKKHNVEECMEIVRRIDIITRERSRNTHAGSHKSIFKGRGIEITDTREYTAGDDTRAMDWKITARYNKPYIRLFNEDRERTIYIAIDISASGSFGFGLSKSSKALEAAATLIFSAEKEGDQVGLILFTDIIERFIPARKGRKHCISLINEIIRYKPSSKKTDLQKAFRFMGETIRRKSCIIIISDFDSPGFKESMEITCKKHELQAIFTTDRNEFELPDVGPVRMRDPETGELLFLDTSNPRIRERYSEYSKKFAGELTGIFKKNGIKFAIVDTRDTYMQVLQSLRLMAGDL